VVCRAMSQPRVANERGRKGGAMKIGEGKEQEVGGQRLMTGRRVSRSTRKNKIEGAR
jgi:hypothetical protein